VLEAQKLTASLAKAEAEKAALAAKAKAAKEEAALAKEEALRVKQAKKVFEQEHKAKLLALKKEHQKLR
jgi:hypothetical protein